MTQALRDAAQALLDIVMQQCGGYTSGPGFEAAEKARALRAALSAPQPTADERPNLPTSDASMPVVCDWSAWWRQPEPLVRQRDAQAAIASRDERIKALERELAQALMKNDELEDAWANEAIRADERLVEKDALQEQVENDARIIAGLEADLREERDRIASMRTEWGAEVAALTAQARHAEDKTKTVSELAHGTIARRQARIAELEAPPWFLESHESDDAAWEAAQDAYEDAAGGLRGHLEWRDRVRAAVRSLIATGKPSGKSS